MRDGNFLGSWPKGSPAVKAMNARRRPSKWKENGDAEPAQSRTICLNVLTSLAVAEDTPIFERSIRSHRSNDHRVAIYTAAYQGPRIDRQSARVLAQFTDGRADGMDEYAGVYPDRQGMRKEMLRHAPRRPSAIHVEVSGCYGITGADDGRGGCPSDIDRAGAARRAVRVQWIAASEEEHAWERSARDSG